VRIVLDTNVLVSALLRQGGIPDQVAGLVLAGRCHLIVDSGIVAEYQAVLRRPEFGFPADEVDALLAFIERSTSHCRTKPTGRSSRWRWPAAPRALLDRLARA
jgi:predicted nucleic acid-binding protein